MYLHDTIFDSEKKPYKMAGVIHAGCMKKERLVRFGYLTLNSKTDSFLKKEKQYAVIGFIIMTARIMVNVLQKACWNKKLSVFMQEVITAGLCASEALFKPKVCRKICRGVPQL